MNIELLCQYLDWTDKKIRPLIEAIPQEKSYFHLGKEWDFRKLLEHYVNSYDYLWFPKNQSKERIKALSAMTLEELLDAWEESRQQFVRVATKLSETIKIHFSEDQLVVLARDDYFLAHSDHLTFHRGQLVRSIKQLGYEGVNTDYYTFLAETLAH